MKYALLTFILVFQSCVVSPRYDLKTIAVSESLKIDPHAGYVLVKNNFPENTANLSTTIDTDFRGLFSDIALNPQFLAFENNGFLLNMNSELADVIKNESNKRYLILVQLVLKPALSNTKYFSKVTVYKNNSKREYHVIIRLIDLELKQSLYTKEAMSAIKIPFDYSTLSTTEQTQLIKTYYKVMDDFKKYIIEKKK